MSSAARKERCVLTFSNKTISTSVCSVQFKKLVDSSFLSGEREDSVLLPRHGQRGPADTKCGTIASDHQFHKVSLHLTSVQEISSFISSSWMIEFVHRTFTADQPCEYLHTQKTKQYYYEAEPGMWMVMVSFSWSTGHVSFDSQPIRRKRWEVASLKSVSLFFRPWRFPLPRWRSRTKVPRTRVLVWSTFLKKCGTTFIRLLWSNPIRCFDCFLDGFLRYWRTVRRRRRPTRTSTCVRGCSISFQK